MAYNELYYARFKELPSLGLGLTPAQFKVSLRLKDYSGTSTEVELYHHGPVKISKTDSSNNPFLPFHALQAVIRLRLQNAAQMDAFNLVSDRQMMCIVSADWTGGENYTSPVFYGWVEPTDLSADYKKPPFEMEIRAFCGLASLKERTILRPNGKRLKGYVSLAEVLRTALYQTGFDLPLETGVNLYEFWDKQNSQSGSGYIALGIDPLYQTQVSHEAFLTDKNTPIPPYDVLKMVNEPFGITLAQIGGRWMAPRTDEMIGGWDATNISGLTLRTRTYDNGDYSAGPTANQAINLNVAVGPNESVRVLRKSPKVGSQAIQNGIRESQSFGRLRSIIPGFDLSEVDGSNHPVGWVGLNIAGNEWARAGSDTEADPYRLVIYGAGDQYAHDDTPLVQLRVEFASGSNERYYGLEGSLQFEYELTNCAALKFFAIGQSENSEIQVFCVDDPDAVSNSSGSWKTLRSLKSKQLVALRLRNVYPDPTTGHDKTKPGYASATIDMGKLEKAASVAFCFAKAEALDHFDGNGHYTGPEMGPPTPKTVIRNIRFVPKRSDAIINTGAQQTILKDPKLTVKDTSVTLQLGDVTAGSLGVNSAKDYTGTLVRRSDGTPTQKWFNALFTFLDPVYSTNPKYTLLGWNVRSRARQALYAQPTFRGVLEGRLEYGCLSILRINDIVDGNGNPLPLQVFQWEWDLQACTHNVGAGCRNTSLNVDLPGSLNEWQASNGSTLPMGLDEDGNAATPTLPTEAPSLNDKIKQISAQLNGVQYPKVSALVPNHVPIDLNTILPKLSVLGPGNQVLGTVGPLHRKQVDLSTLFP